MPDTTASFWGCPIRSIKNDRIQQVGIPPVEPKNSYWRNKSETYEDPDGWCITFFNGTYQP